MSRRHLALSACALLAACDGMPNTAAPAPALAYRQAAIAPPPPPPPPEFSLTDYMFGPPPHNRMDPGLRCRFNCPKRPETAPLQLPPTALP